MLIPKQRKLEDKKWRQFVASRPCFACGIEGYSQAAHIHLQGEKSKGAKVPDDQCLPLCHAGGNDCHRKIDQYEIKIDRNRAVISAKVAYQHFKQGNEDMAKSNLKGEW